MKCTYCGTENSNEYKFCIKCGAQLKNGAENVIPKGQKNSNKGKKKGFTRKLLILLFCIFLVIGLYFVCKRSFGESDLKSVTFTNPVYKVDEEQIYFVKDNILLNRAIEGKYFELEKSVDGSVVAVLNDSSSSEESELMLISDQNIIGIDEEVDTFKVSALGKHIGYIKEDGALLLCDNEGNRIQIASDVASYDIMLSPDGKCVAYYVEEDDDIILFVYDGKKSYEIGENIVCIGISNAAKQIYYGNLDNMGLYVTSLDGESTKLSANIEYDRIAFNNDYTQLLFSNGDSWYITDRGKDKVKISDASNYLELLIPVSMGYTYTNYDAIITYGVNSLFGHVYYENGSDSLFYLNEDGETENIVSGVDDKVVSDTEKDIFYTKNHQLYKVNIDDMSNRILLAEDVAEFKIVSDGSAVYYTDLSGTIYYQKGTKTAKRIADDVWDFVITHDNYVLFITDYGSNSGVLYSSKNGKAKEKVADDVYRLLAANTVTYYYANYDDGEYTTDLYGATKNTDFNFIIKGVQY